MERPVVALVGARSRAERLLDKLSLSEKIGQLVLVDGADENVSQSLHRAVAEGRVGSVINEVDPLKVAKLQRIAREETAHGIPLLIGRDVIHGFKTIFPIPLGLAATWNEELVEACAKTSAEEAAHHGVNWTFAPMIDVSRDPRWGRIAESFGEDPYLTARMGTAMVRGFQNGTEDQLLSCLKHFAGYGASESGKDYDTTNIPEIELRNVYLPPFKACLDAGALTIMPSFSDLNGIPASGNAWLMRDLLRGEWCFAGFVVSDWCSIPQLAMHGVVENERDAALQAARAGVNMDMVGGSYATHLEALVENGILAPAVIDELVREVLTVKFEAGLFDSVPRPMRPTASPDQATSLALRAAQESLVLLKNNDGLLPFSADSGKVCLLGPLADQAYEQLGTWVFDADLSRSVSVKDAFAQRLGDRLSFDCVLKTSRDKSLAGLDQARQLARECDHVVLVLGEESILSGEAHCRADVGLPGAQASLVSEMSSLGKPVVVVVMAGRPLVISDVVREADAVVYAWHPGTMAGPAICNVLFGDADVRGRLPVSLPRAAGQIPIYYAHGHTGKPVTADTLVHIDDIAPGAPQTSIGNASFHLDVHPSPLFPFGFGLSYGRFLYKDLHLITAGAKGFEVAVNVANIGERAGSETVQLYTRDLVASATRPVRELKAHKHIRLDAGEHREVRFALTREDLKFFNGSEYVFEPGRFRVWVGADSTASLSLEVQLD